MLLLYFEGDNEVPKNAKPFCLILKHGIRRLLPHVKKGKI